MYTKATMPVALVLALAGTGCATKKYVTRTVTPIEQRVSTTETKNTEQDKQIAEHATNIESIDRDLSQAKEKLTDTTAKVTAAEQTAKQVDQKAATAQQAADSARQSADGARTFAEQGIARLDASVQAANKFQLADSAAVLFAFDRATLTPDAKAKLDELAGEAKKHDRYVIEVQGFTDRTGTPAYNVTLSERRADQVARYLVNQHEVPVRDISMLGSGYALPVADGHTREGRKMNRRVEIRLWVPGEAGTKNVASGGQVAAAPER